MSNVPDLVTESFPIDHHSHHHCLARSESERESLKGKKGLARDAMRWRVFRHPVVTSIPQSLWVKQRSPCHQESRLASSALRPETMTMAPFLSSSQSRSVRS
jgi:hypothetical protein